jgi:histidine ammonia-lyase
MGTIAIRQCREILNNVEHVIAVEMLCAAQAYDLLTENNPLKAGKGTREAYKIIREKIPYLDVVEWLSCYFFTISVVINRQMTIEFQPNDSEATSTNIQYSIVNIQLLYLCLFVFLKE